MAKKYKPDDWIAVEIDRDAPEAAQVGALWRFLYQRCKVDGLDELNQALTHPASEVARAYNHTLIDYDLWDAMADYPAIAALVRAPFKSRVAACSECGNWALTVGTGTPKCIYTPGCEGRMIRCPQPTGRVVTEDEARRIIAYMN